MYYKEEWINGILYWKASPNGEWIAFTMQQYKDRCLKLEAELKNFSKANVSGQLPNNLILYRQAKKLDYAEFCKWLNAKLGNLR